MKIYTAEDDLWRNAGFRIYKAEPSARDLGDQAILARMETMNDAMNALVAGNARVAIAPKAKKKDGIVIQPLATLFASPKKSQNDYGDKDDEDDDDDVAEKSPNLGPKKKAATRTTVKSTPKSGAGRGKGVAKVVNDGTASNKRKCYVCVIPGNVSVRPLQQSL